MKWFVILLICAGLVYAGYHYRDQLRDVLGKASSGRGGSETGSAAPGKSAAPAPAPDPPKPPVKPEIDPEIAEKFPLPRFKPLEELVGNWQNIPPTAFPRVVTLKKPVEILLAGGVGKTTMKANSEAAAIGISGDLLTVTNKVVDAHQTLLVSPGAPRGSVPIDDTNFKQVLGEIYEAWKKRKTSQVLAERKNAMRERENGALASANPSPPTPGAVQRVPEPKSVDPRVGPRPEQAPNGTVPVMVSSIKAGDVTEIKVDEIERWGPVRYELVDGEPYWTANVSYQTKTLFGPLDTEAQALIRRGKVANWVYTGSGEDVP